MKYIITLIILIFPIFVLGDQREIIESSLTADSKFRNSIVDGDEVVKEMSHLGIFSKEPFERADYTSYYFPKKQTSVLGHNLIYFEYEYMEEFVGCCVDDGTAVVLQANSNDDTKLIEDFAQKNHCRIEKGEQIYMPNVIEEELIQLGVNITQIVELSCKANDRFSFNHK